MKKGFTLIELLAVIVILAIIGIITVPLIGNIIETSRNKAALLSTTGHIKAIENELIIYTKEDGVYDISDLNIQINGEKAKYGYITLENNEVKEAKFCIGKVSTEYNGEESIISENDYCSDNYEITLIINGEKETKKIGLVNKTEITLNDINGMTNVGCNNGTVPKIENNTLKLSGIYGDTTCVVNDTLNKTFDSLDDTTNTIIMISDESLQKTVQLKKEKDAILDLNGKTITRLNPNDPNEENTDYDANYVAISVKGNLRIIDDTSLGNIISQNNADCIVTSAGSKLIIDNGNFNGRRSLQVQGEVIVNGGNFKSKIHDVVYNNGTETININGGTFSSDIGNLVLNYSTGTININDGYFHAKGADRVALYNRGNGTINVYDGYLISDQAYVISNGVTTENSSGTVNVYKGYLKTNVTSGSRSVIVNNSSNSIINVNGKNAQVCTSNETEYVDGICMYSKRYVVSVGYGTVNLNGGTYIAGAVNARNLYATLNIESGNFYTDGSGVLDTETIQYYSSCVVQENTGGTTNIKGGTFESTTGYAIRAHGTGNINIQNANIISNNYPSVVTSGTTLGAGTINICNADIKNNSFDLELSGAESHINYSGNVIFNNRNNNPTISTLSTNPENIIPNYLGTC